MRKKLPAVAAVLVLILISQAQGFILTGNQQTMVNGLCPGINALYDTSRADVVSGGNVYQLKTYDNSSMTISDSGNVTFLNTYENSNVDMYNGTVQVFGTQGSSSADIYGGSVHSLGIFNSSFVSISGGSAANLYTHDFGSAELSGGSFGTLGAYNSSIITFNAQDYILGDGLFLIGNRLSGTGLLSGKWMDESQWTVSIAANDSTASIVLTPEPATLLLFTLGGLALRRKR
jgi:hypothetical protein